MTGQYIGVDVAWMETVVPGIEELAEQLDPREVAPCWACDGAGCDECDGTGIGIDLGGEGK